MRSASLAAAGFCFVCRNRSATCGIGGHHRRNNRDVSAKHLNDTPNHPDDGISHGEIPIIYEDDRILAVNKPPHLSHHDDDQSGSGIISLLREQRPDGRLYGMHRLDRVTSGVLLLAKDSFTASALMTKFAKREVVKYYVAISHRKAKKKQGWVRGEMAKSRRGSYKLIPEKQSSSDSKEYAVSRYFTAGLGNLDLSSSLARDETPGAATPRTLVLFQPKTGRTHQLRVAAKSIGLPILGDSRYGGGRVVMTPGDDSHDRSYLHACAMSFTLDGNEPTTIWSPPPFQHLFASDEFNTVLENAFIKHCDCQHIVDALLNESKVTNQ